jgi:hypothetical protein
VVCSAYKDFLKGASAVAATSESDNSTKFAAELDNLIAGWAGSLNWGDVSVSLVCKGKEPFALHVQFSNSLRRSHGVGKHKKVYPLRDPEGRPIQARQIPWLARLILSDFNRKPVNQL